MLKLQMALCLCLIMLSVVSCQEEMVNGEFAALENAYGEEFTGVDIDGNERTCHEQINGACTLEFTPGDQYALDCERAGDVAIGCGCHDFICVAKEDIFDQNPNEVVGLDINGNVDSCVPLADRFESEGAINCSEVFTEEDQFSMDCKDAGYTSVQCDCHKFLCVK